MLCNSVSAYIETRDDSVTQPLLCTGFRNNTLKSNEGKEARKTHLDFGRYGCTVHLLLVETCNSSHNSPLVLTAAPDTMWRVYRMKKFEGGGGNMLCGYFSIRAVELVDLV